MAKRADIEARLSLDSSGFKNTLTKSKGMIKQWSSSAIGQFAKVGAAFLGIGLAKGIAKLGLAAGETASKFNAVFGPAADDMNDKVQKLRETIPATTAQMQDSLSTIAAMAKGFGLNAKAARLFSVEMVKITGDIASFHDLSFDEAFSKIQSAISGQFEPLRSLGVVIDVAKLKQEALNIGIWDGVGALSSSHKALAVQSILIRDLGDANGDAAITANSAANKVKFLMSNLQEMGTEIGTTLLPGISALTTAFAALVNLADEAMTGVGTALGELVFGQGKGGEEGRAIDELKLEGITQKSVDHGRTFNRLVKERIALNRTKDNDAKRAKEDEIKGSKDLAGELQKQAEAETDPARKKALMDRLAAYKELLKAAGQLDSVIAPKKGAKSTATKSGDPFGMNIEQREFEDRNDFLRRREQARQAKRILDDKLRQQAQTGESAGITDDLVQSARGNITAPSGQVAQNAMKDTEALTSIKTDMKTIATELTRTQ